MHLTALVQGLDHVCCRYRLAAFRPHFERAGHRLELRSVPRSPWGWLQLSRSLPIDGAVIVQRKLLHAWQLFLLRRHPLLFDFDDAVFLRDSYAARGLHDARRLRGFARTVRAAARVIAGNDFLRLQAQRHQAGPVTVIPTCVELARYPAAPHRNAGTGVELVWLGSPSTMQGLERARPILEAVGQRCPGLHLKIVCSEFLDFPPLPVRRCPWSEASEAADLASADIGISWLPDDDWSRGKCGLKVLQYMAAGLPVIANPVGVQAEMVRPGETGFLAETPEQWIAAIEHLAADPALRRRMGAAARLRIVERFDVPVGAAQWLGVLDALQHTRRRTG